MMASIEIENLHQHFGSFHALKGVDLVIKEGEFFSLLGPSGSGKTSLLRVIAGFDPPTLGRILIGGEEVTHLSPEKRRLGMVFQNYALFPHLSVFENVAYGLRAQKFPTDQIRNRVRESLNLVDLVGFDDRDVHSLSGGQQQRVAFARAIAPRPRVLLMDEPLSNLDTHLRVQTRRHLKSLQKRLGMTTVYVTHDQSEALALSDRLAILFSGEIAAAGTPTELYPHPPSEKIGRFLGDINVLECGILPVQREGTVHISLLGAEVEVRGEPKGDQMKVGVRPESFAPSGVHPIDVEGTVEERLYEGDIWRLEVRVGKQRVRVSLSPSFPIDPPKVGDRWSFSFPTEAIVVLE